MKTCVNLNRAFALNSLLQKYEQVGFSGIEVSPMDDDVPWFSPVESYAWDQEYNMAALALVYHATSTSSEADLKHLMETIVSTTPSFTEKDSDFRPPHTWSTTERGMVNKVKELLIESMPWDRKGTAPIIHVGIHTSSSLKPCTSGARDYALA